MPRELANSRQIRQASFGFGPLRFRGLSARFRFRGLRRQLRRHDRRQKLPVLHHAAAVDEYLVDIAVHPCVQRHLLVGEQFARQHERALDGLSTYASYLGIDPDKVVEVYARSAEEIEPEPPSARLGRVERMIAASRIRDNQRFLLIAAASILIVLLAFGLLTRGEAAPPTAVIPSTTASPIPDDPTIRAVLASRGNVTVESEADGVTSSYDLRPGETITLVALERLVFSVEDGGLVDVSVNGKDQTEGVRGSPHTYRFTLGDNGGQ